MNDDAEHRFDAETARRIAELKSITDDEITESWNCALDETDDAVLEEELRFVRAAAYRWFTRLDEEDGGWEDVAPRRKRSAGPPGSEAPEGFG